MAESHHNHTHDTHAGPLVPGKTTDPVCGMSVDPATTPHVATHAGTHHYFCSAGCLAKFNADPMRVRG
jgi:Cu+-exporting ATPase